MKPIRTARGAWGALAAALLLAGCSATHTEITGEGTRNRQVIRGTCGVCGEDHDLTILAGSEVEKLSIIGEGNKVWVDDGAWVKKVEIAGEGNVVSLPGDSIAKYSQIGEDNELKYRSRREPADEPDDDDEG